MRTIRKWRKKEKGIEQKRRDQLIIQGRKQKKVESQKPRRNKSIIGK